MSSCVFVKYVKLIKKVKEFYFSNWGKEKKYKNKKKKYKNV